MKVPAAQLTQDGAPPALNVPAAQAWQLAFDALPVLGLYVPAGHCEQEVDIGAAENVPAGHGKKLVIDTGQKEPAGQNDAQVPKESPHEAAIVHSTAARLTAPGEEKKTAASYIPPPINWSLPSPPPTHIVQALSDGAVIPCA